MNGNLIVYLNNISFIWVGWGGVDWIGQSQDMDRWRALLNVVMNLRVP
jgi:hypothetical protein